jgi:Ca2+-transporting ATPase
MPELIRDPFTLSIKTVLEKLESSIEYGLTENEAMHRLNIHGKNDLEFNRSKKKYQILLDQFFDPIILILAIAILLTFFLSKDWLESIAIAIVILLTITIGFFMELQGIRSLETLRKMGLTKSNVLRDGKIKSIVSSLLVPGDIIILEAGDVVCADARLISNDNLLVKEASLTGESISLEKQTNPLPTKTILSERTNMVYRGTSIVQGNAKAIVVCTGHHTELGKIQKLGSDLIEDTTPLEKKLNELSKWLIWLTAVFAILIVISGYLRGMDMFVLIETAIALAVAAIPEGLPVVATIALARGILKLSKQQVIIKKMEAVETLGATNIICTDKTGTLTHDELQVHTLVLEGNILNEIQNEDSTYFDFLMQNKSFQKMMMASILCNNVLLNTEEIRGDSIELALIKFAKKLKYNSKEVKLKYPEAMELPFDTNRKLMVTLNKKENTGYTVYAKGAYESIVIHCDTIIKDKTIQFFSNKNVWLDLVNNLASHGLRVLAFAYKDLKKRPIEDELLSQLTFIGVIGFLDPAREDVKSTIKVFRDAGIKVIMMTGDHPGTAKKIASDVGLICKDHQPEFTIHGKDLDHIFEQNGDAKNRLLNASIFARVTPEQKLKLITFFQDNDTIVGMLGDGINDIPALRKADIGIAMGIRGTQAAREASDIILKNDNFNTMELAIRQGRAIYDHIRQFVVYLLSCNLAEVVSVGLAALLNLPAPLLPLQILFLNLVTDIFPALALGMGKGEMDIMNREPRKAGEPIMTPKLWSSTVVYGLCITVAVIGITAYSYFVLELPSIEINNMAFYTLLLGQLFNVFNMSKNEVSFFSNEIIRNPWVWGAIVVSIAITAMAYYIPLVAEALFLTSLSFEQFGWVFVFALGSLALAQIIKRTGGTF